MVKRLKSLMLIFVLLLSLLAGCGEKAQNNLVVNQNKEDSKEKEENVPKFNLITEGVSDYVIVHGKDATETEIYAAEELQDYLKQISDVELAIVTDSEDVAEKEIIVGKTNREAKDDFDRIELTEDGFVIKTTGSKLWLVGGGNRGTLYSVYTLLEEYLGCRFFTKYVEKVPKTTTVAIPEIEEDKQIPVFLYRDESDADYSESDISVKRKFNINTWGRKLSDKFGGGIDILGGGHTFELLVPREEYFDRHPEYYSLNSNGARVTDQLCLTNPDVLKVCIKGVREWLAEDPDAELVTVSQNDLQTPCLCDNCKKVYEEEGGTYSGTLIRFVNAIAKDIQKDYPNVLIDTYAYQYTRSAPTKTKPAKNVNIRICTIEDCFSHPHEEDCDVETRVSRTDGTWNSWKKDLTDWDAISDNLWVYDYHMNFAFGSITFPDFDLILANYRYYAEHNVVGIMPECNSRSTSFTFGELRGYLLSKVMWNPYMSLEEYNTHMDEFLNYVYGPGAKYLKEYLELAREETKDMHLGIGWVTDVYKMYPVTNVKNHKQGELPKDLTTEMIKDYQNTDWTKYWNYYNDVKENKVLSEGEKLFQKAMKLVENESQYYEMEKAYVQIESLRSYYLYMKMTAGSGMMNRMIASYIEKHASDFTEEEKKSLPTAIEMYADDQMTAKYVEYNKALCEKMVHWGATTHDGGGSMVDYMEFEFASIPTSWS